MKKKIGDLTLRTIKKNCKQTKHECNVCDYCDMKRICYSRVWELMDDLDKEIEVEENVGN